MMNDPLNLHRVDDVYWTLWVEAEFGLLGLSYALAIHSVTLRMAGRGLNLHFGMLLITLFFAVLGMIALGWTNRIRWRWLTPEPADHSFPPAGFAAASLAR